ILQEYKEMVRALAFSPDGKTLASGGSDDRTVRLWSLATGQCLRALQGQGVVAALAWSPDSRVIASAGAYLVRQRQENIVLWEAASGNVIRTLPETKTVPSGLAFSPDGKSLAAVGPGPTTLWDIESATRHDLGNPGFQRVNWLADGKSLAVT